MAFEKGGLCPAGGEIGRWMRTVMNEKYKRRKIHDSTCSKCIEQLGSPYLEYRGKLLKTYSIAGVSNKPAIEILTKGTYRIDLLDIFGDFAPELLQTLLW